MKAFSILRMVRHLQLPFAMLTYLTAISIANASMTCLLAEKLPTVSDPLTREKLEAHVKTLPGLKDYQIRAIDDRFFIVMANDGYCNDVPRCEHRLLDLHNGVINDVFAYRGTGRLWRELNPLAYPLERFQEEYARWAFATTDDTFIFVELPRFGGTVRIDAPTPEETKMFRFICSLAR